MDQHNVEIAEKMAARNLLSETQIKAIKDYRSLGIFSLHNELLFLLYLSVLLATTGVGILIYKNIDTIGHTIILAILLVIIGVCYYFSFKNSIGFRKEETNFESPVYNYIVLLATILSCIFLGYIQFQYKIFGTAFSFVSLVSAVVALSSAFYFDNRSALSIGITALAAFIGITATPQALLENDIFVSNSLCWFGVGLGVLLICWTEFSERKQIKKHFNLVILTFALHLMGICCITGFFQDFWGLYVPILAFSSYYFYRKSYEIHSVSIFIFTFLYAFVAANILAFRFLDYINIFQEIGAFFMFLPIYFVCFVFLFIQLIKHFNRHKNDSNA